MTDAAKTTPDAPDFPIIWTNEEDQTRFWALTGSYMPVPFTPMEQDVLNQSMILGSNNIMTRFQAGSFNARFFNGYYYGSSAGDAPVLSPAQYEAVKTEIVAPLIAQFAGSPCADSVAFQAWSEERLAEVKQQLAALARYDFTQPLPTLLDDLDDACRRVVRIWERHTELLHTLYAISTGFEQFYQDLFGKEGQPYYQLLHKYEPYMITGNQRLRELSRHIQRQPALATLFLNTAPKDLWSRLEATPEAGPILSELQAYLADYGKQGEVLYLRFPYWAEDPAPMLLNLQKQLALPEHDLAAELSRKQQQQAAAVAAARQQLTTYPQPVIDQFEALLDKAQKATYMLDEHIYWIELAPNHHLRQLILAIGRAFQRAGCLEQAADIFYLHLAELRPLAAKLAPPTALIAERTADLARSQQMTPPPFIGPFPTAMPPANPVMDVAYSFFGTPLPPSADPTLLVGYGVSPGIAQGPVKVLRSVREAAKLEPGDILVTGMTTPAWTPIFAIVAGIITDSGGMLSHPAIIAREMGIPAVVGISQASSLLHDGQQVLLNGATGQVRILE